MSVNKMDDVSVALDAFERLRADIDRQSIGRSKPPMTAVDTRDLEEILKAFPYYAELKALEKAAEQFEKDPKDDFYRAALEDSAVAYANAKKAGRKR